MTTSSVNVETSTLPTVQRKSQYRAELVVSGGTAPYRFKKIKRSLPKGLKLTKAGVVEGKAMKRGTKRFKVKVVDSSGATSRRWVRIRIR